MESNSQISDHIAHSSQWISGLKSEISKVLIGRYELVDFPPRPRTFL